MKALSSMKKSLVIIIGAFVTLSLTACPSGSPQNAPRQRGALPQGVTNPGTGQYVTGLQWGAITTSTPTFSASALSILTNGASIDGTVSGNANDGSGTGVEFDGQIDQNIGQGNINFAVWDSGAAASGLPITWNMPVVQVSGTSNGANVMVQQGSTIFEFQGVFTNGLWQGYFGTGDGAGNIATQLGTFNIMACSIFSCN